MVLFFLSKKKGDTTAQAIRFHSAVCLQAAVKFDYKYFLIKKVHYSVHLHYSVNLKEKM